MIHAGKYTEANSDFVCLGGMLIMSLPFLLSDIFVNSFAIIWWCPHLLLCFSFLQIKSGHTSWTKYRKLSWHNFICCMCSFSTCKRNCSVVSKSDCILTYTSTRIKSQYLHVYNLAFSAVRNLCPLSPGQKKTRQCMTGLNMSLGKCGAVNPART